jgi:hypothetical protein
MNRKDLHQRLIDKYGPVIDLRESPGFLYEVYQEMELTPQGAGPGSGGVSTEPFGVSWMDSWVAHWIYNEKLNVAKSRDAQVAAVLQGLVDLKFNERLGEIQRYISNVQRLRNEVPDGGPPEPGTPGAGPSRRFFREESGIFRDEPPDGGPPEPGTPPAGPERFLRNEIRDEFRKVSGIFRDEPPDGGPPEPGTPPAGPERAFLRDAPPDGGTPEPGVPPAGPDPPGPPDGGPPEPGVPPGPPPGPLPGPIAAVLGENPWILYWFISIKAPVLLDVIDAHITRRINALGTER